jgi:hypothetical protein
MFNQCYVAGGAGEPGSFMMMAMAWMVMAMMMYFMRPNSLRGEPQGKPQGEDKPTTPNLLSQTSWNFLNVTFYVFSATFPF